MSAVLNALYCFQLVWSTQEVHQLGVSKRTKDLSISYRAKKEAATEVPVEVSLATQEPWEAGTLLAAGLSAL